MGSDKLRQTEIDRRDKKGQARVARGGKSIIMTLAFVDVDFKKRQTATRQTEMDRDKLRQTETNRDRKMQTALSQRRTKHYHDYRVV